MKPANKISDRTPDNWTLYAIRTRKDYRGSEKGRDTYSCSDPHLLVMQNAKDSFYMALRSRLAVVNPARTILLRGATRPGMLVADAEAPSAQMPCDVFVLRWLGLAVDMDLASTMAGEDCEISYSTSGTQAFGGLDRGRMLSTMDAEILAILQPFHTGKMNYAVQPASAMQTQIFWDEPSFTPINVQRDRLSRSARVMVYSYREQGES